MQDAALQKNWVNAVITNQPEEGDEMMASSLLRWVLAIKNISLLGW
jgi:hypothetical protein